jgi:hypothetical protein
VLADLATTLARSDDPTAVALGARLHPFTAGAFSGLFDGPTTSRGDGRLVVYSLRDLADE